MSRKKPLADDVEVAGEFDTTANSSATAVAEPDGGNVAQEAPARLLLEEDAMIPSWCITAWLGIAAVVIANAWKAGKFRFGVGEPPELILKGARVIAWIENDSIECHVTEAGRKELDRRSREAAGPPAVLVTPATDAVGAAVALTKQREEKQKERSDADRSNAMGFYFAILRRSDNPHSDDASALADIMLDWELSPEKVVADRKVFVRIKSLEERAVGAVAAQERVAAARDGLRKAIKAQEDADRELIHANGGQQTISNALHELALLKRRQPEFFDVSDG